MKALSNSELAQIAYALQSLVGAQLQDITQTDDAVGLAFYHERQVHWLWFDMNPSCPVVLRFTGGPPVRKKLTKPLVLFARAHVVGKRLAGVRMALEKGRILEFEFHQPAPDLRGESAGKKGKGKDEAEGAPRLEARLFPHGQNVTIFAAGKAVSLRKAGDAPALKTPPRIEASDESVRSWEEIQEQWRGAPVPARAGVDAAPADAAPAPPADRVGEEGAREWRKQIEKKERALEKMRQDLERKTTSPWAEVGEWLKVHGSVAGVPREWADLVDPEKSLAENLETCFQKAKDNRRKRHGAEERIAAVEDELKTLRELGPEGFAMKPQGAGGSKDGAAGKGKSLLEKAKARGRRHAVAPDLEAYIGKSAADNLALLRRAQPFDLWLHLRDYPGAHAILRRTRNRLVHDHELLKAGRWVVEQSLHKSTEQLRGEKFDMLVVECRYVKPIKGDKLGRVTYQNDRVVVIDFREP